MAQELQLPTVAEFSLLLWLNSVPRIGPATARLLLSYYQTPDAVFRTMDYTSVPGLRSHMAGELAKAPKGLVGFKWGAG